jgi:hypothetical protein
MLTVKDRMTLDYETRWWKYAGGKEATIRDVFGESATRYYQRLNHLLDQPEALAYAPLTVTRLQRLRAARARRRSAASINA